MELDASIVMESLLEWVVLSWLNQHACQLPFLHGLHTVARDEVFDPDVADCRFAWCLHPYNSIVLSVISPDTLRIFLGVQWTQCKHVLHVLVSKDPCDFTWWENDVTHLHLVSIEGLIVDTWGHVHFVLGVSIIVRAPKIGSPYSFVAVLLALLDFVAHMFANSLNMLLPLENLHSSLQCCLVLCHDSKQGVCRRTTNSNSTSEEVCFIRLIVAVLFNGFLPLLGFPLCIKDA